MQELFNKRIIVFILLALLNIVAGNTLKAQVSYSPITMSEKGPFKKKVYTRCDVDMNADQLMQLLAKDPSMNAYVMHMATYRMIDRVLLAAGTVMLSLPVIDALRNQGNPNWKLAYIGGAALTASIPFHVAFKKRACRAVTYYNSGYNNITRLKIELKASTNQLAVLFTF